MKKIPLVLTIAGSDCSGGAGIQADLKTMAALGAYGMSVITALTAQNTLGVQGIYDIPAEFIGQQLDSIFADMGADVVKTGMLSKSATILVVADKLKQYQVKKLVVDPVMVAKSGDRLLRVEAQQALIEVLLPLSLLITPNLPEAEILSGININSIEDMKQAAIIIQQKGAKNVLVKGGHLQGDYCVDLLYDGKEFLEIGHHRVPTNNNHGTGCTFASAIASLLGQDLTVKEAVIKAKQYLTSILQLSLDLKIGRGIGPMNHTAIWFTDDHIKINE